MAEAPTTTLELRAGRNGGKPGSRLVGHAVILDDEFAAELRKRNWSLSARGRYPSTSVKGGNGRRVLTALHHLVWQHYRGPRTPGLEVIFIDGNARNAVPSNLRETTRTGNMLNRCEHRQAGPFKDVRPSKNGTRWVAYVREGRKYKYLGTRDTGRDAARLVNAYFREHHPEIPLPNPTAE